ncbi:MAG TPA: hypothetical protein VI547_10485 [Anaerolineales bacterium]|nr:hypothetical protein [Anaerolineales bacterium]
MANKPPFTQDKDFQRRELRRNQVLGILTGLIGGWMTGNFWPFLSDSVGWAGVLLWGAAIGAMLGSLAQFERAGKVLTRGDNRILNLAIGVSVPLLIISVIGLVLRALR